jgi:cytochrome c551/c552
MNLGRLVGPGSAGCLGFFVTAWVSTGCSPSNTAPDDDGGPAIDSSTGVLTPDAADATSTPPAPTPDGGGIADAGTDAPPPTCITPTTPQACAPPVMTALPICKLSQTGCMDPTAPTHFAPGAVYYEVNSPLWSDDAAKMRAFVLPDGGTIHVKDCSPDASALDPTECVAPNGTPNGPADTGKWVFPVGTVMIKNFLFDGKVVETRLLMRVDAAAAAVIQNGTDWVGYNYAWNEEQTEADIVPDARTAVSFNTGLRTVTWNYPDWLDCITCHAAAVGTLGPETDQMNREVDGGNQIDTFVARGFFDGTAPKKPYTAPLVEPYSNTALGLVGPPAGATTEEEARSYLGANCGFCHRPDVNDFGFDLRPSLSFYATGICNLTQQNGIPGMTQDDAGAALTFVDFAPGNHAASAMWIRMNIAVPPSDPDEEDSVGRMPVTGSFVVDTQGTNLVGAWIDSVTSCPPADGGE